MLILLSLIIFFILGWGLLFYQISARISMFVLLLVWTGFTFFLEGFWLISLLGWLILVPLALFTYHQTFRHQWIIPKILHYFRKALPKISQTEQAAIEAGDVWWEAELFRGSPDWQKLLDMPQPKITQSEEKFLSEQVEVLCGMIDDWKIRSDGEFTPQIWAYLKKERFFGIAIPQAFGGLGFSSLAHSHIVTKIATRSVSVAVTVMVPNALGPAEFLQHFGTEEQKNHYLPRLATGEEIPAFALTSPQAGSDASGIPDTGIICVGDYEGRQVLGARLNWDKRYITLAPVATLLGLAVKLYDPEHHLSHQENIGITLFLVPTHLKGVETGKRHLPAGLAFLNGPTRGKDVFVPLEFIIGGLEMRGQGWRMMMEALAVGRGISLPALGTAVGKLSYRMTGIYAQLREQFGQPIGQFEGIQAGLARIGGLTYLCEAARYFTLSGIMQGFKPSLAAAIAKYHITEMGRMIANEAMDIHAGRGIQMGPRNYLALLQQSLPISITVEGANILTRNLIIFGQGAIRCHPYIQAEIAAAHLSDKEEALRSFDAVLMKHIRYVMTHLARVIGYGLTGARWIKIPDHVEGKLRHYYRQLTYMSTALALTSEVVMALLGGELKRSEQISARLGDVLSYLYLSSAVLNYHENHAQSEDLPFVVWSLEYTLSKIQDAFDQLFQNLKPRWAARILKRVIFPWGRKFFPPHDQLTQTIAEAMQQSSPQRDRLTEYCYFNQNPQDSVGRMEHAFALFEKLTPTRQKLRQAIAQKKLSKRQTLEQQLAEAQQQGILSAEESEELRQLAKAQADVIQVDEF